MPIKEKLCKKKGAFMMKTDIQNLKTTEITSDVFVISPTQIDFISQTFGDAVAAAMNVRPLSHKIREIAQDILIQTLKRAKSMGE